jgi:hypothetical protein
MQFPAHGWPESGEKADGMFRIGKRKPLLRRGRLLELQFPLIA